MSGVIWMSRVGRNSSTPFFCDPEQETFGFHCFTKEWTRISWQKACILLQVNWSSSPTPGKCTISEWQFLYRAPERFPGLCFMFYVELVPVTRAPWHHACHTSFDGVKYAHGLINWLTDEVMTVSLELTLHIHPDITYRGVIIYEDCQKRVAYHVFLLGLGSRCDFADVWMVVQVLRTSQLDA